MNFRCLIPLLLLLPVYSMGVAKTNPQKSICSWTISLGRYHCPKDQYQCWSSNKCIQRSWYCDNGNDCGDNSDEAYCDTSDPCPTDPLFIRCKNSRKCIPYEWICNGYNDCPNADDERDCSAHAPGTQSSVLHANTVTARDSIKIWLRSQKLVNSVEKWGANVDKSALIFHFAYDEFNSLHLNTTLMEITYELNIQLLSHLTSMKLGDIPSTDLASYLNAFLVMCINPRNFHGYDIVQELRNRVENKSYAHPYVLLALCNAGETITESDRNKLIDIFENKHRTFWTDMQAVAVMALACANKQPGNEMDSDTLREMTLELKQQQFRNGSIVNLPTTALVLQALIGTNSEKDPDNFDETKALQELLRHQMADGSFGDLMSTLLVTPVLACKSLADINSHNCHYGSRDEISALENLSRRSGPKIRVHYALWIGDKKDLQRNLVLQVPKNTSLYAVMEIAAEVDSRFQFQYSVKDRKPYINAVSGMRDNPLAGKFWFLYIVQDGGEPTLSNESPADIMPKENVHYVMWYRSGTWMD